MRSRSAALRMHPRRDMNSSTETLSSADLYEWTSSSDERWLDTRVSTGCGAYGQREGGRTFGARMWKKKRQGDTDTREAAFVNAIASAGVAQQVTRDCSRGHLDKCGCDMSPVLHGQPPKDFDGIVTAVPIIFITASPFRDDFSTMPNVQNGSRL
ncbi:unnamed protein product [Sphagnum balticum]